MNLAYFHTLIADVKRDTDNSKTAPLLQQLIENLQNQVNDPANPGYQSNVGGFRIQLEVALRESPVAAPNYGNRC